MMSRQKTMTAPADDTRYGMSVPKAMHVHMYYQSICAICIRRVQNDNQKAYAKKEDDQWAYAEEEEEAAGVC